MRKYIPKDPYDREHLQLTEYNDLAGETVTIAYRKKFGNLIYLGMFRSDEEAYQAFVAGEFEVKDREWLFKFLDKCAYESDDCYWVTLKEVHPETLDEIEEALGVTAFIIGTDEKGTIIEIRK